MSGTDYDSFERPADSTPEERRARDSDDALATALTFVPEDLEANRQGRVSRRQARRLWLSDFARLVIGPVLILIGLAGSLAGRARAIPARAGGGAAVALLLGVFLGWSGLKLLLDLLHQQVAAAEGELRAIEEGAGRNSAYYFVIGDQRWEVFEDAYDAIDEGNRRLYYLPMTRRVLSVEPVSFASRGKLG